MIKFRFCKGNIRLGDYELRCLAARLKDGEDVPLPDLVSVGDTDLDQPAGDLGRNINLAADRLHTTRSDG